MKFLIKPLLIKLSFIKSILIQNERSRVLSSLLSFILLAALWLVQGSAHALTLAEAQKLLASDAAGNDNFGRSVSVSGDTAVIGAFGDDDVSGSAYVFVRDGTGTWREQQKLTASDGDVLDSFGISVAVSGDTAVIGAFGDDDSGSMSGSAYVFVRGGTGRWREQQKLTASDAAANDLFGNSVAVSGDTAIIGAFGDDDAGFSSGSAYVFVRDDADTWDEQQKLTASGAAASDQFGISVAASGDTAVIGALSDDGDGPESGSASVFVRDDTGLWREQQKLTASDATSFDDFGTSVTVSGDTAVIGAPFEDAVRFLITESGSAYVFSRDGAGTWREQQKLTASDVAAIDRFGTSVAVSGDAVVIGAEGNDDNGSNSGSAYVFSRDDTDTWTEQQKLTASDAAGGDAFGRSVALSDDTAVIGATFNDDNGSNSGSAYVFEAPPSLMPLVLVNNRWTMVSLAFDPGASNTVQDIFDGILIPSDYNSRWVVYERDESFDTYVLLSLSSDLQQGQGYWVLQITGIDVEFAPSGSETPVVISNPNCPSQDGCFEIELTPPATGGTSRFNLIGHPFDFAVAWNDIRIEIDGVRVCTPQQTATNKLMTDTFWNYNGNAYDNFSTTIPPGGGSFEVFKGYWVELLTGSVGRSVKLLIPNGPASDQPSCQEELPPPVASVIPAPGDQHHPLPWWLSWISTAQADSTLKRGEWWVRLLAHSDEAGGMIDKHNYLGWYRDAEEGKDHRDVVELPPFGSPYLTIVFAHDDWAEYSGDYASDMRKKKNWREGEEWDFIVKSDQLGREVTLSWDGYDGIKRFGRMRLFDMESGEEVQTVRRGQLQSYTFNMYDTQHRFKWVYKARPKQ